MEREKVLIVVDMQNDFVNGALGSDAAISIVPHVMNKIKNFDGMIVFTRDTHCDDYLETTEGKYLPIPHCIKGTSGWSLINEITQFLKEHEDKHDKYVTFNKMTFGDLCLADFINFNIPDIYNLEIEIIGLCTDICVASNALILKAAFPDTKISVDSSCCAGTTKEAHDAALTVMRSCQIEVY